MKLIALKNTQPFGHRVKPGETFELTDRDAKAFIRIGHAKAAPEGSPDPVFSRGVTYKRRDMQAEAAAAPAVPVTKAKPAPAPPEPGRSVGVSGMGLRAGSGGGGGTTSVPAGTAGGGGGTGAGTTDEAQLMSLSKASLAELAHDYSIEAKGRTKAELVAAILAARAAR